MLTFRFTLSLAGHSVDMDIPESLLWSDTLNSAFDAHIRKTMYQLLQADGTHPRFHLLPQQPPHDITDRIAARRTARQSGDYAASDDIRRALAAVGVELIDHADGDTTWRLRQWLDPSTPKAI